LASFHINHAYTFNGSYELPFGKGRKLMSSARGVNQAFFGGWSINWIASLYSGQPQSIGCPIGTTAGAGCFAFQVPGQEKYFGSPDGWYNPAAFRNPPVATQNGQSDFSPLGGQRTQLTGPGFAKMDFSMFKDFRFGERYRMQFRAETFNLTNTPAFANPAFTNFIDTRNFGRVTSTRNSPNDARQIQLALKMYF
jgi:hypothetical protein